MFFKNSIDIEGRLTTNPELKTSQNGTAYCRFSIAYNQSRKDKNSGEWINIAHFFNCVTFKKMAENVATFQKGNAVTISGILQYNSYEKDGQKKSNVSILVNDIKLLSLPKKGKKANDDENNPNNYQSEYHSNEYQNNYPGNNDTYDPDTDIPF